MPASVYRDNELACRWADKVQPQPAKEVKHEEPPDFRVIHVRMPRLMALVARPYLVQSKDPLCQEVVQGLDGRFSNRLSGAPGDNGDEVI